MNDEFDPDRMPRTGTAKMIGALVLVPAVVLVVIWALVRIASLPEISEDQIMGVSCDTTEEITTFSGQLDPEELRSLGFDSATLRVEFTAFLARAEGSQRVSLADIDPDSGLIDLEITEEISGPANCDVVSFIEEPEETSGDEDAE